MTVGELILALMKFSADWRVVVVGYETGCDDLRPLQVVRLKLDVNEDDWNGPHKVADYGEPAVLISDIRNGGRFML
jgi:hypothetical protein